VVRTAQVELSEGLNTLRFEDLPESVDSRGIQVNGSGDAMVLDVRFKTENFKEVPKEEWKALYDKQAELQEQEKVILQKMERFTTAKGFLNKISNKVTSTTVTEGEPKLDPESWSQMLELYTAKSEEYDDGYRQQEQVLRDIRKELTKVQADIRDAGAVGRKQRRVVEVDLAASKTGAAELKLSYMVYGPQWVPTYDIRVDSESRQMDVKYFAMVRQNTGEDWSDVTLKLSTANPGLGGQHPELEPWRISLQQPYVDSYDVSSFSGRRQKAVASNKFESDALYGDALMAEPMPAPIMERESTVSRQGASVVFEVSGKSSVEADNVEHRVAVSSVELPSIFRYSAIPKLDQYAYLKAKATNSGAHPLLAGNANIFLDGSFLTTSSMDLVAPNEEFWVFLGADESMKVEHKLIKKYQSKEGLGGKTTRHSYEYLLTVKNTHGVDEEVILWDQLPISGTEGLKVKLIQPKYSKDTDALKIDDEQSISWFRKLQPGEEWKIPFQFYVDVPKGKTVEGL
jgi:uncharacterized protein (TIGR02231 family)